jgi:ADP-ribose pyrophosphatase YjhB (NUDIX family)
MIIHKKRPFPIFWLRKVYYFFYNPILKFYFWIFKPSVKGVKSFIFKDEKILLVRLGYAHRSWVLPGGGIDRGEGPEVAAAREVYEESGIKVSDLEFVGNRYHTNEHKKVSLYFYYGQTEQEDIIIDDQEIVDAGWFDLNNLPEPRREKLDSEIQMYNDWRYGK